VKKVSRPLRNPQVHCRVLTRTSHWSLSWARWIQSTPLYPIPFISVLLTSHLRADLPSALFHPGFLTKYLLYAFLIAPMRTTCPTYPYLIPRDLIALMIFGEGYKSWSSSLRSFLHVIVTSLILDYWVFGLCPSSGILVHRPLSVFFRRPDEDKIQNSVVQIVIHHRQNPLESNHQSYVLASCSKNIINQCSYVRVRDQISYAY
jgi:hypothetical protein